MERFMKCGEVAKILGVHASSVRKYCKNGLVKHRRNPFGWVEIEAGEVAKIRKIIDESRKHYLHGSKLKR